MHRLLKSSGGWTLIGRLEHAQSNSPIKVIIILAIDSLDYYPNPTNITYPQTQAKLIKETIIIIE